MEVVGSTWVAGLVAATPLTITRPWAMRSRARSRLSHIFRRTSSASSPPSSGALAGRLLIDLAALRGIGAELLQVVLHSRFGHVISVDACATGPAASIGIDRFSVLTD